MNSIDIESLCVSSEMYNTTISQIFKLDMQTQGSQKVTL